MKNTGLRHPVLSLRLTALALLTWVASIPAFSFPSVFPTGTTIYDPTKTYNSYVIFSATDGKTYLIDLDGNVVKEWSHFGFPAGLLWPDLTGGKRGHVIVQLENGPGDWGGIFKNKSIAELDWDGNIVWQWGKQAPGGEVRQNHDWARLPNGNTLVLATLEHKIPSLIPDKVVGDQAFYEVNPQGEIVWKWIGSEHLDEFGFSPEGLTFLKQGLSKSVGVSTGFLTFNNMKLVGPNHWFDEGDKRFNPDNIIFDSRDGNFTAIIDKKTGKIVWRLGPYYANSEDSGHRRLLETQVPRPVDQISGQHDAQIIPKGLPGAGNLLVFDNQGGAGFPPATLGIFSGSRVLEIDPIKKEIVWQYTAADSDRPVWDFGSSFISSARRLPNGNTLIDEGANGRFIQITPKGEIVWEYVSPYFVQQHLRGEEVFSNWVYRAIPIPYDWVPDGTPHSENPVTPPDLSTFHVPTAGK